MNKNMIFYIIESILALVLLISYLFIFDNEIPYLLIFFSMIIFNIIWLITSIMNKTDIISPSIELAILVILILLTPKIFGFSRFSQSLIFWPHLINFLLVTIVSTIKINLINK